MVKLALNVKVSFVFIILFSWKWYWADGERESRSRRRSQKAKKKKKKKLGNKMVVISIDGQLQISRLYPIPHLAFSVIRAIKFRRIRHPLSLPLGWSERKPRNRRACWVKSSFVSSPILRLFVWLRISFFWPWRGTTEAQCNREDPQKERRVYGTHNTTQKRNNVSARLCTYRKYVRI